MNAHTPTATPPESEWRISDGIFTALTLELDKAESILWLLTQAEEPEPDDTDAQHRATAVYAVMDNIKRALESAKQLYPRL